MSYLIGIDIGTTSGRTIIVDENGQTVASSTMEYPLITPKAGWSEQNPDDWWNAVIHTLKEVFLESKISPEKIECIGLTGQMHGSVFLDKNGHIIRPAILWNDQRTFKQCDQIYDIFGYREFIKLSHNKALAGFTAPKILWLKDNEPQNFKRIYKVLLPKDYIRYKLSGKFLTEVSDASGTVLLDVANRTWSKEILDGLKICIDILPGLSESTVITSTVDKKAASLTGLLAGTPIAGGGSDNTAGAIGTGVIKGGMISDSIGTSGVVFASSDKPVFDKDGRIHCWCHSVPGKWLLVAATLSAAGSLKWYSDAFGPSSKTRSGYPDLSKYKLLDIQAENVSAGSDGLIFLPYLTGERYLSGVNSRYGDPHARGVFFGMSYLHTPDHFARSIMEGVAYSQLDCLSILEEQDISSESLIIFGGGSKSKIWQKIIADITNKKIQTLNIEEGPSFGAALIAGVASGVFENMEIAVNKSIRTVAEILPSNANVLKYSSFYRIYKSLYEHLKIHFKQLSEI